MDSKLDQVSFPGGYDFAEQLVAVTLAALRHVKDPPLGETQAAIFRQFLLGLAQRHPDKVPFDDAYLVRGQELFDERRSLLNSHLGLAWFGLAYWVYGLIAVRSRISQAEYDDLDVFLVPVRGALRELGIRVSAEECLAELERFLPEKASAQAVQASTLTFLSFTRFLHGAALRRRQVVTPGLSLPSIGLAFAEGDADQAGDIASFLTTHGITVLERAADVPPATRLLVLLSRESLGSDALWTNLADWRQRHARPMVLCLFPKAEFYKRPPDGERYEVWEWLAANVAVELSGATDRYLALLRALDSPNPKQWWWNSGDAVELGAAVDVLRQGIPRPAAPRKPQTTQIEPYPFELHGLLLSACLLASQRLLRDPDNGPDQPYFAMCNDLLGLRLKVNGEPYGVAWFVLIYRAWLAFASGLPGFSYSAADQQHAERELQAALFALGIGSTPGEIPKFLQELASLPWPSPATTVSTVDERTAAFMVLVQQLSQAALARSQRMALRHRPCSCFVSYARADEDFTRQFVGRLEAKGVDVWWDLNAITLGAPLDGSLSGAVADARVLILVATPAAEQSTYVRLEVETALREGLRIIPVVLDGDLPSGFETLFTTAPQLVETVLSALDAERPAAFDTVLNRLQRSSTAQLDFLQSRTEYQAVRDHLARMRVDVP